MLAINRFQTKTQVITGTGVIAGGGIAATVSPHFNSYAPIAVAAIPYATYLLGFCSSQLVQHWFFVYKKNRFKGTIKELEKCVEKMEADPKTKPESLEEWRDDLDKAKREYFDYLRKFGPGTPDAEFTGKAKLPSVGGKKIPAVRRRTKKPKIPIPAIEGS